MEKIIDFKKSIFDICREYPEVIDIMKGLGFEHIASPGMLNTAGRFMTIPKGAAMKNVNLDKIKEQFVNRGYEVYE